MMVNSSGSGESLFGLKSVTTHLRVIPLTSGDAVNIILLPFVPLVAGSSSPTVNVPPFSTSPPAAVLQRISKWSSSGAVQRILCTSPSGNTSCSLAMQQYTLSNAKRKMILRREPMTDNCFAALRERDGYDRVWLVERLRK